MDLYSIPRYPLATLPTPLEEMPRLSKELGVRVLIKRDDMTGFAMGGNKVRNLEFLVADALDKGANVLVTSGGVQSNHVRVTVAAAQKAGMDAVGVFFSSPGDPHNGNVLLEQILGARLVFAQVQREEMQGVVEHICEDLRAEGRRPYLIPPGGSTRLGVAGYVIAVDEALQQLRENDIRPDALVITTGSCGTHAGVLLGMKYFDAGIPIHGISVSRSRAECLERIPRLVGKTADLLEHELVLNESDIIVHDGYLGEAYAKITPEARAAIQRVARLEGIFLDPVYTGKCMAGLIDLVARGTLAQGSTILFWHTGGAAGLFGFPNDVV